MSGLGCGTGGVSAASAAAAWIVKAAANAAKESLGQRTSVLEARRDLVEQRVGRGDRRARIESVGED
ncbi:hypothetical protein, partial [Mesorhizobium sp.]|uniref:hypothetical protein n=1 Tax=Mesorhizobium sp. TaxID=1871066 RepID=UPI0025FB2467